MCLSYISGWCLAPITVAIFSRFSSADFVKTINFGVCILLIWLGVEFELNLRNVFSASQKAAAAQLSALLEKTDWRRVHVTRETPAENPSASPE
jgi:hypothetical protein